MAKKERFVTLYRQGVVDVIVVMMDTETGVNYLFRQSGYAGGMTPLLDQSGNVVISSQQERLEAKEK